MQKNKRFLLTTSVPIIAICFIALLINIISVAPVTVSAAPKEFGDIIPGISCSNGMTATVYAEGLTSPDGLAFDADGLLHVAQETAGGVADGKITQIAANGTQTDILTGLIQPEGIAFDSSGNLYYVSDDINNGEVIKRSPAGITTTIAGSDVITSAEGIAIGNDGTIYVTASDAEKVVIAPPTTFEEANEGKTYLYSIAPTAPYTPTILLQIDPGFPDPSSLSFPELAVIVNDGLTLDQPSFSGITIGSDGKLYIASESSGVTETRPTSVQNPFSPLPTPTYLTITVNLTSTQSIFVVDPAAPPSPNTETPDPFIENLTVPEGLHFQGSGGEFPLLIVEEVEAGSGSGRLLAADASGNTTELCSGFGVLEDVITDADGNIYVTDDTNGQIVKLAKSTTMSDSTIYLPLVVR